MDIPNSSMKNKIDFGFGIFYDFRLNQSGKDLNLEISILHLKELEEY